MRSGRQTEWEDVDNIVVPEFRHRHPSPKQIEDLAQAIEKDGQMHTPITVRLVEHEKGNDLVLVAGLTRLEAAKRLGWKEIECFVDYEMSDVDAELIEITENLHRAELTKKERAEQVARWIELQEQKAISSQVATKTKKGRPESGARRAARELGLGKDEAHRSKKIASLSDEAKKVAESEGLDNNQSALLAASREASPDAQVTALKNWRKPVSPPPEPRNDIEVENAQMAALMNAWNKASAQVRQQFLERVQPPIMDEHYA